MAREIITWCDMHMRSDERVPAITYKIGQDGKWYSVDLCDTCADDTLNPIRDLLNESGVRIEAPVPSKGAPATVSSTAPRRTGRPNNFTHSEAPYPCPWCASGFSNSTSLVRHASNEHAIDINQVLGGICPVCSKEYQPGQGIASHVSRAHGSPSLARAFLTEAEREPNGYAAKVVSM